MTENALTLVLGGTGKTGRRVARRLTGRDEPVRIGSRAGGVPFDWEDQATWMPALRDVTAAYVSYYPDLAAPGAPERIGAFAARAVSAGVRRRFSSFRGAARRRPGPAEGTAGVRRGLDGAALQLVRPELQ